MLEMKYNSGAGAVLCSKCRVIMDSNWDNTSHKTYQQLQKIVDDWFCFDCDPEAYKKQGIQFIEIYQKVHRGSCSSTTY